MRNLVIIICSLLVLASCYLSESQEKIESFDESDKYELIEIDSYGFRRAYHGHDTLTGDELDLFMNRNPEPNEDYTSSDNHPLFSELTTVGLIKDGNLNITELDTLPEQFDYQFSHNNFFKVKTRLLEDPKEVKTPSYELTFMDENKSVLIDTLEFDWPPDVTFIKTDLDKDGTEELLSIYRWYIVNGDNFDLKIYKLKK
ncbi:MAG: hypothetical protein JNJ99_00115 [Crocinitomicaceae bacterium]|nr:hypothetical protein [Crocinitomicaceae bacterium]